MITIIKSPLIESKLGILRNKNTSGKNFRRSMDEISYLIAAEVALSDEEHLKKSLEINANQESVLMKGISDLGYDCIPTKGNFISFNSNGDGEKLFNALLKEGVIIRTLGVYKMPNYLRVTIGLPEENSIFLDKLSLLS